MKQANGSAPEGVELLAEVKPEWEVILSSEALELLAILSRKYSGRVTELLERRRAVQARFDVGEKPHFLAETKHVRLSVCLFVSPACQRCLPVVAAFGVEPAPAAGVPLPQHAAGLPCRQPGGG